MIEKEKENKFKANNKKFDKLHVPVVSTGGNRKERREILFRPENVSNGILEKKNDTKIFSKDDNKTENSLEKLSENVKIVKIEDSINSNENRIQNITVKSTEKNIVTTAVLPEISDSVFLSFLLNFRYLILLKMILTIMIRCKIRNLFIAFFLFNSINLFSKYF